MSSAKIYTAKDRKVTEDLYHYFLRHGEDDGWGEKDKYGNFQTLITIENYTHFPLKNASILDVGCGTGDMAGFLREHEIGEYQGIDIVDLSIQYAHLKYPKEIFKKGDFLRAKFDQKFDYVFCSGTLAAVLPTDNYHILNLFLQKMATLCTRGAAINFLTKRFATDTDDLLFLYDLETVLTLCKKIAPKYRIEYELNRAGDSLEFLQTHLFLIRR